MTTITRASERLSSSTLYEEVLIGEPINKTSRMKDLALSIFKIQRNAFNTIQKQKHLPHEGTCPELFRWQAVYLATLAKNDGKSPLSQEDTKNALIARKGKEQAKAWLNNGLACGTATIIVTSGAALVLAVPATTATTGAIANLLINPIINLVNWASTGFYPDVSSRADDIKARTALEAQSSYDNIALTILKRYKKKPEEVKEFVELFAMDALSIKLKNDLDLNGYSDDILRNLRGVFGWIKNGEIDAKSKIYEWIEPPYHHSS